MVELKYLLIFVATFTTCSTFSFPSIPSIPSLPSLPSFNFSNLIPSIPSLPKIPLLSKFPKISWADSIPQIPQIPIPKMPNISIPKIPKIPIPKMLNMSIPEMLNISIPEVPKIPIPEIPNISVPKIPPIPDIPTISIPSLSSIKFPSLPSIAKIPSLPNITFDMESIVTKYLNYTKTLPMKILEEARAAVPELIEIRGYPCETHQVTTSDGYVLAIHRIPHGRRKLPHKKQVVFLQHGLLASSADWVLATPEKGLGYILADAGYDVWMGNTRGNRYSRNHTSLNPDDAQFWDYSWHEMGIYDVPAMIDYVLEKTKYSKLYYVGHSQGTTAFYVMCSEQPEYNNKIKAMFSLAPVAYMNHMSSPLFQVMARGSKGISMLLQVMGINEFLPYNRFVSQTSLILCNEESVTQVLCTNSVFALCGFNDKQINHTLLPIIMGHTPAGSSTKQLLHFAQEIISGKFREFDYGTSTNQEKYNSSEPPSYQLSDITAPVYLFYSRNDWLSGETDVTRLFNELGNVRMKYLIADDKFNHLDYLFATESSELVYTPILKLMKLH